MMQELALIREAERAGSWPRAGEFRAVHLLAALPLADVVVAQVQARLDVAVGPLSLAQAFHGVVFVLLLGALAGRARFLSASARPVVLAAAFFAACVALSAAVRAAGGRWLLEDLTSDLKVLYWLAACAACMVLCRRAEDYRTILVGLVAAGTYAAAAVIAVRCLDLEGLSPYEGVEASAGGLNTAKGLGGILAAAGLVWVWLTRRRRAWLGAAGFALCYCALALTYQRTGLVAGGAAALWLAAWGLLGAGRGRGRNWALRPIALCVVPALLFALVLGTEDLQKRWSDLDDLSKAGSWRLTFWQEAAGAYGRIDLRGKAVGVGYAGLLDATEAAFGVRLHSHSDVTDALVVYGALGLVAWLAVLLAVLRMIVRRGWGRPEAAAGVAVFLVMAAQCVLTGQVFGPHVMSFYLLAICGVCLGVEPSAARGAVHGPRREECGPPPWSQDQDGPSESPGSARRTDCP